MKQQPPYYIIDSGTTITQETMSNSAGQIVVYSTPPKSGFWTVFNEWYEEEMLKHTINTNVNKLIDE